MCHYTHYAKDKRCADFILKMHQERLAARLHPIPMEELTTLPHDV